MVMVELKGKQVSFDSKLKEKLDLIGKRVVGTDKRDALILVEAPEGYGKSNFGVVLASYLAKVTGRTFENKDIFFRANELVAVAKDAKEGIYLYDEPALDSLRSEWFKAAQTDLVKLLMMARKKRHIFIFCITKFNKFNEYIIERAIGMVHIYTRNEVETHRRFVYYRKSKIEALYNAWRTTKKRQYKKYCDFRGSVCPYVLPYLINEDEYETAKDAAIMKIGAAKPTISRDTNRLRHLETKIAQNLLGYKGLTKKDLEKTLGISNVTINKYLLNEVLVEDSPRESEELTGLEPILM